MGLVVKPAKRNVASELVVVKIVVIAEVVVVVVFEVIAVISQELKYKNVVAIVLEKPLEIKK